jgi:hypothetical protein
MYDDPMDGWDDYPEDGSFMMRRYLGHGFHPPAEAFRPPRRRMTHSEAGSRRSYSQSIISDMYGDEMDTVEEEDEDALDGDSSMNDFIDDDDPASSTSRSVSSTPSQTPQPSNGQPRRPVRTRRVVESETSSTISSVIEEEDEEDEEDQGPIRRGQRQRAQTRMLNRANGSRRRIAGASSTSTDVSGEQELDEDTQALLRAEGWMLQHDGPDEEMDEDDESDGGQTTVGWDATAISNDRFRMGGSLTPTADRPRPNAPIRPPSRTGNPRFPDTSRGLRRRSSILSTSVQLEDGEADDDNSDFDQDGDYAMAMNSLRARRSRAHLRNLASRNSNNNSNSTPDNLSTNRGLPQGNAGDLDTDDNSDTSQPAGHRTTPQYDPRISWMFADHQRALQEFQRSGPLVDVESRSNTPIARPRPSSRNRPSPAQQYSPFLPPAPARMRTPMMDHTANNASGGRVPASPQRRNGLSPPSATAAGTQNGIGVERAISASSTNAASSAALTAAPSTPSSQHSANAISQAQAAAAVDMIDRPPSRVSARPPSAAGRRTSSAYSPVYPTFAHNNIGLNIQGRIMQNQRMGNPWGAFVQPHGVRTRTSRPALRDQSSTATLRAVASRQNINVNQPQVMRTQTSRIDLRHQPSRRRLNNQSSTRTLRASEHARPPQPTPNVAGSANQTASRPTRFTPDERDTLARELINNRMRALGGSPQGITNPVRTNPFSPGFRRADVTADTAPLSTAINGSQHSRNNSSESVESGRAAPSSPSLGRRRSNRNMATAPLPVLPSSQGAFPPPTTAYTNAFFRSRQGSFTGTTPGYESSLSPSARSPMVAATGQLI